MRAATRQCGPSQSRSDDIHTRETRQSAHASIHTACTQHAQSTTPHDNSSAACEHATAERHTHPEQSTKPMNSVRAQHAQDVFLAQRAHATRIQQCARVCVCVCVCVCAYTGQQGLDPHSRRTHIHHPLTPPPTPTHRHAAPSPARRGRRRRRRRYRDRVCARVGRVDGVV